MAIPQPSAEFKVNGSVPSGAVAVAAGSTVDLELVSTFGVRSTKWRVKGTHSSSAPTITIPDGASTSFTMPNVAGGQAYLIECEVNNGRDPVTGRLVPSSRYRAIVGVLSASGVVPFPVGERLERSATHGWTEAINAVADSVGSVPEPSDATPQAVGTATAGTSDDYARADHVHGRPNATGCSIECRSAQTTGVVAPLEINTHSIPARGQGSLFSLTISPQSLLGRPGSGTTGPSSIVINQGEVACRPPGQNVGSYKVNDSLCAFANNGFTLNVAPQHVATLSSIADSGDDSTSATLGSDGIYLFTVLATATGSGGSYLVAYKVRGQLASGTLTLGTPVPIEDDDTGDIDLSFADDSGALEVTVSNTSGVTVNALVAVGWLFCPVPAAP